MIDRSLVDAAARLRREDEPHILATVVRARRPGTRLLLTRYRWISRSGAGSAFAGDLAASAWRHTKDASPVIVTYDAAHDDVRADDDLCAIFGLGNEPTVDVMFERAADPGRIDVLELAARCARLQRTGAVATVIRAGASGLRLGSRLALITGGELEQEQLIEAGLREDLRGELLRTLEIAATELRSVGGIEVLVEAIEPPPRLFVFGTGHDLVPLAQLARQIGWETVICSETPCHGTHGRFALADEILVGTAADLAARIDATARALCVIGTHDAERDRSYLAMVQETRARYVGVLGDAARHGAGDPRVHELSADTPHDLAFTAIGEAQQLLRRAELRPRSTARPVPSRPSAVFATVAAL